jgi:hypothetical protein
VGLLDKIKAVFTREKIPEETKLLLSGVTDVAALRRGLDEIITRNEVERRVVERECDKLGKIEDEEKGKIREGQLNDREKLNSLRYIKRLGRRIESYEKRQKIHEENVDLHQALMDRIDEMEAMELKAVKQEQIEEIAVDYEERLEKHREVVAAGKVVQDMEADYDDVSERRELEALEKQILQEAPRVTTTQVVAETSPLAKPVSEKSSEEKRRVSIDEAMKAPGPRPRNCAVMRSAPLRLGW